MKWSPQVQALQGRVVELRGRLTCAQAALHEAKLAECGIKIGDIVQIDNAQRRRLRVTKIDPNHPSRPWVSGNPERADGTFGTAVRNIYDSWRHTDPVAEAEASLKERLQ